jgi:hypothetical protein
MWWRSRRRRRWKVQPNKENIRKWIDALRGGEFEQGQKSLRQGDKYCCLGVACEVSGLGSWGEELVYPKGSIEYEDGSVYFLPQKVSEWLGLSDDPEVTGLDSDLSFVDDDGVTELTTLNDEAGWNFHQIADAIERTYLAESA